jgi:parallel beta-helix repeat protein
MTNSRLVVFTLFFWLSTGPAFGVSCGQTIVVDTTLNSNLTNCSADGIVIGVDNIKLNLNGFIIDGVGSNSGILLSNRVGVEIIGPGVVREFSEGILVQSGNNNVINDVILNNNTRGIHTLNSSNNEIRNNTASENTGGIQISGGTGDDVAENDTHGNNIVILVSFGKGNLLRENNSHGNALRGIDVSGGKDHIIEENQISEQGTGISIRSGANGTLVERNYVTDNPGGGILLQSADDSEIVGNIITNSFTGVRMIGGLGTLVQENTFSNNGDPIVDGGAGTVVVDNICDPPDVDPVCN